MRPARSGPGPQPSRHICHFRSPVPCRPPQFSSKRCTLKVPMLFKGGLNGRADVCGLLASGAILFLSCAPQRSRGLSPPIGRGLISVSRDTQDVMEYQVGEEEDSDPVSGTFSVQASQKGWKECAECRHSCTVRMASSRALRIRVCPLCPSC